MAIQGYSAAPPRIGRTRGIINTAIRGAYLRPRPVPRPSAVQPAIHSVRVQEPRRSPWYRGIA